jgi:hypothetical protein
MGNDRYIMGLFPSENSAAAAVKGLAETPWRVERVHSPVPSHLLAKVLNLEKSGLGWFTLVGGITGFFFGFLFAIFTATRWDLIVGGKPIVALVPFFIVGFEFTILFAVIGNVIGLLTHMHLPRWKSPEHYDPRCSGSMFGVLAECTDGNLDGLKSYFEDQGGEVKCFES